MHNRFKHDDGTCTSSLASGGSSATRQWMAVGAESGAVSLFNNFSGETEESDTAFNFCHFQKQRTVLNLTTKVTSMAFHPSAEIVAIASDQVRMISLSLSLSLSLFLTLCLSFHLSISVSLCRAFNTAIKSPLQNLLLIFPLLLTCLFPSHHRLRINSNWCTYRPAPSSATGPPSVLHWVNHALSAL